MLFARPEADFIQGIVEEISQKLKSGPSCRLCGQPEPHRLSNTGSHDDVQMLVETGFRERGKQI